MKKINITPRRLTAIVSENARAGNAASEPNVMLDARYLRQSSSLIQDALQKGFDVLQLANGDIVMTGTKTVVYQYEWSVERGKLVKLKPKRESKKVEAPVIAGEDTFEETEEA